MSSSTNAHGGQATSSGAGMRGENQDVRDAYDAKENGK
jgi:hypothetical protein